MNTIRKIEKNKVFDSPQKSELSLDKGSGYEFINYYHKIPSILDKKITKVRQINCNFS